MPRSSLGIGKCKRNFPVNNNSPLWGTPAAAAAAPAAAAGALAHPGATKQPYCLQGLNLLQGRQLRRGCITLGWVTEKKAGNKSTTIQIP